MATLKYVEAMRGHTGSVQIGKTITAGETRKYRVFFNGTDATLFDAVEAAGVPAYGASLGPLKLTSKTGETIDDCSIWEVSCNYEFPQPGEESKPTEGDIWAVSINVNSVMYEYEAQYDADGKPIANTAGDPITGVMRPKYDEEMTISFRSTDVNSDGINSCIGKINSTEFTLTINGQDFVYPEKTVLFSDYSVNFVPDVDGNTYPQNSYRLRIRQDTWTRVIANKGVNRSESGERIPITRTVTEEDGTTHDEPIQDPVYLTTDYDDTPPTVEEAAVGATVEQLNFEIYEQADLFALLLDGIGT